MAMTQERFDTLVQQLERYARRDPQGYKLRVGLLAGLGYGYIFLAFLILFAIATLTVGLTGWGVISAINGGLGLQLLRLMGYLGKWSIVLLGLLLIPVIMVVDLVRSLWVHIPKPTGLALHRQDAPQLFAMIDELTTALQAPSPNHVLLTPEFNAAVMQRPRLGLFGWDESYLLLGLPLMQALSPQQFQAVLAHEFGHLSGNHSRFGGWIYRQRMRWFQLLERFQINGGASLFNRFLLWYAPFFNAYSFVLARMDEYEADRCAVALAGEKSTAAALVNIEVKARFIQQSFWSEVYQQMQHLPDPPDATYSKLMTSLRQEFPVTTSYQWLDEALACKTNNEDTHPCLSDRLQSLGISEQPTALLQETVSISAADQLLGHTLQPLVSQFDQDWRTEMSTPWRQRFAHLQEVQKELQALDKIAQTRPLSVEEAWMRACNVLELRGDEAGIAAIRQVLESDPAHAAANYTLGKILLQRGDRAGVMHLETGMTQNVAWGLEGCQLLWDYFTVQGEPDTASKYQQQAEALYNSLVQAQEERSTVSARDSFKPHTLTAAELHDLQQHLADYREIEAAYLVEKVVQYFPEERFLVLGVVRKQRVLENSDEAAQVLLEKLMKELTLPSAGYILILNHSGIGKLKKMIPEIERSHILPA